MKAAINLAIVGILAMVGAALYFTGNLPFSIEPISTSKFDAFKGTMTTSQTSYNCSSYDQCEVTFTIGSTDICQYPISISTTAGLSCPNYCEFRPYGTYYSDQILSKTVNKGETAYLCIMRWSQKVKRIDVVGKLNSCPIGAVTPPTTLFSSANGPYSQCTAGAGSYCEKCIQGGGNNFQYCKIDVTKADGTVLYSGYIDRDADKLDFPDGPKTIKDGIPSTISTSTNYQIQGFKCKETCGDGICQGQFSETAENCPADCSAPAACGIDGLTSGSEVCDPSNTGIGLGKQYDTCTLPSGATGQKTCKSDCSGYDVCVVPPACGNGQLDSGEQCDDGNMNSNDGCSYPACRTERCGDGITQTDPNRPEECDDGNLIDGDACSNACKKQFCGDMKIQTALEEECDDGNTVSTDSCTNSCKNPKCGDGFMQPSIGEECDDGNAIASDSCTNSCKLPRCGDSITTQSIGEECDDGKNGINTDSCLDTCKLPRCRDGYVQTSRGEECDDGNAVDVDICTNTCKLPRCGDNIKSSSETCELFTPYNTVSGCKVGSASGQQVCQNQNGICVLSACSAPGVCGNGIREGSELCDDGNANDFDECSNSCQTQICGDGDIDTKVGETCEPNINPKKACGGDFFTPKLGYQSCSSATCRFLDSCNTTASECIVGADREACGFGGYYPCVRVNIGGIEYGKYDRSICQNSGICTNGNTRLIITQKGWNITETCTNNNWPTTCTPGTACISYQDACAPGETQACTTSVGIPGMKTCIDRVGGLAAAVCSPTGTCVPGSQRACGDCGSQTCDTAGSYGVCQPQNAICQEQFSCQKETTPGTTFLIFEITPPTDTGRYLCAPVTPIITIQTDRNGYAIKTPIKIPVLLQGPSGAILNGVRVRGEIADSSGLVVSTGDTFTDSQGIASISFTPTVDMQGTYKIRVTATVGGQDTIKEAQIEIRGKVDVLLVSDSIQYFNKPIVVLLKFVDDSGNLVTEVASLNLQGKMDTFSSTPALKSTSNGIQATFTINRAGVLQITGTYKLTINAIENPISLSVEVKQPFVDIKPENIVVPNDVQTGKRNIYIKFTNPQGESLAMNPQEFSMTVRDPTGATNTVALQPFDNLKTEWNAEYNYPLKGEYFYKISTNKPGYGARTYGEAPFPVIKSSILGTGSIGGAGGSLPTPVGLTPETYIIGAVVLVAIIGGGAVLLGRRA